MKKWTLATATGIAIAGIVCFAAADKVINDNEENRISITADEQHVEAMKNGADPQTGSVSLPDDFIVDNSFESHLPLVIIDVGGQEIKMNKEIVDAGDEENQIITNKAEDPFVNGTISIIDNETYDNKPGDEPSTTSSMKIRLRGSSSQKFAKKQYAIKMLDENGESSKVDVLGMGENNDWILNISMLDQSLVRNYVAYKFGSALFPGTPDCKYCEVLMKTGEDQFEYQGVYLMMEKIEEGSERVDIADYTPGDKLVSYLLCRDRIDPSVPQLSTYASENNLAYGRLTVLYPDDDVLDDYAFNTIQDEIDKVERALYSDDLQTYETWSQYLDIDSFVDYYLFNSIFRNYDAGNNSTYMYKNAGGKLCMGPVWDYDNACNNDYNAIQIPDFDYFYSQAWFDRLVLSETYVKALENRYKELSAGIFSADYISDYTENVAKFLGNAAERDWVRWGEKYGVNGAYYKSYGLMDSQGFVVDRRSETFTDEVDRFRNYFFLSEEYLPDNLKDLEKNTIYTAENTGAYFTILFIACLFSAIVLVGRRKMFR